MTNSVPLANDPMTLLSAALSTERMELLTVFQKQVEAAIKENGLSQELTLAMLEALTLLTREVYDLRRALRAIDLCEKHMHEAQSGIYKHLNISREVRQRVANGTLPDDYAAGDILGTIKTELAAAQDLEEDW